MSNYICIDVHKNADTFHVSFNVITNPKTDIVILT